MLRFLITDFRLPTNSQSFIDFLPQYALPFRLHGNHSCQFVCIRGQQFLSYSKTSAFISVYLWLTELQVKRYKLFSSCIFISA